MKNKQFAAQIRGNQRDHFFRSSKEAFGNWSEIVSGIEDDIGQCKMRLRDWLFLVIFSVAIAALIVATL